MPLDLQSLFDEGKCFVCFGASEEDSLELAILARISVKVIPSSNKRITESGDTRITESGDIRIIE